MDNPVTYLKYLSLKREGGFWFVTNLFSPPACWFILNQNRLNYSKQS